jgi:hypothetical protein
LTCSCKYDTRTFAQEEEDRTVTTGWEKDFLKAVGFTLVGKKIRERGQGNSSHHDALGNNDLFIFVED